MNKFEELTQQRDDEIWEEKPVSPKEFYEKFFPEPFFPIQQEFVDAMLGTNPTEWGGVTEGIAFWGKGAGKDRTVAKIMVYVVYKLLCMKDPHKFLGTDKIDLANVSINARLAKDVFFTYFKSIVWQTINPKTKKNWFEEKGLNLDKDILDRELRFPKNITVYSLDSASYTGEGLNLLVVVFDEISGFPAIRAKTLYGALETTARSRFSHQMKILLLSYLRHPNDFMMQRFQEAENEPWVYRSKATTWEVNPLKKREEFEPEYQKNPELAKRTYECEYTPIPEQERVSLKKTSGLKKQILQALISSKDQVKNGCLLNKVITDKLNEKKPDPEKIGYAIVSHNLEDMGFETKPTNKGVAIFWDEQFIETLKREYGLDDPEPPTKGPENPKKPDGGFTYFSAGRWK